MKGRRRQSWSRTVFHTSVRTRYRTRSQSRVVLLSFALDSYSDAGLCVGEQSSPRVIISPVSCWAANSHISTGSPFSFFTYIYFFLTFFLCVFFFFLPQSQLGCLHLSFHASLCLNKPPFSSIHLHWIQFDWVQQNSIQGLEGSPHNITHTLQNWDQRKFICLSLPLFPNSLFSSRDELQ